MPRAFGSLSYEKGPGRALILISNRNHTSDEGDQLERRTSPASIKRLRMGHQCPNHLPQLRMA